MLCALFVILSIIIGHAPLTTIISVAWIDERYTYILLAPLISIMLLMRARNKILLVSRYYPRLGIVIVLLGIALISKVEPTLSVEGPVFGLSLSMFGVWLFWAGSFILFYGADAFRVSMDAWVFLAIVVPFPAVLVDKVVAVLQERSADSAGILFKLTGMPAFREGVRFSLPGVQIEIAKECSGIRSSIALLLANSLAAHLMLRSYSKKIIVTLFSIPFVIFKNALRIVTISWLGVYVSPDFFSGKLHRNSGLVFSILDVVVLITLINTLQRSETDLALAHGCGSPDCSTVVPTGDHRQLVCDRPDLPISNI
jgi:exosortase